MSQQPQSSKPEPRPKPYGRAPRRRQAGRYVMTVLRMDADEAVRAVMKQHNISASGAVHHLVRLGAGLPPLLP
jgi:hypothetical protein